MYAFANDKSMIRNVEIPDIELEKAKDVTDGLELVFHYGHHYGQNDFQQKNYSSVSVGDVIEYFKGRYWMVMGCGFKELSKEEFDNLTPPTSDIGYGYFLSAQEIYKLETGKKAYILVEARGNCNCVDNIATKEYINWLENNVENLRKLRSNT
jgi:hypothetical protein